MTAVNCELCENTERTWKSLNYHLKSECSFWAKDVVKDIICQICKGIIKNGTKESYIKHSKTEIHRGALAELSPIRIVKITKQDQATISDLGEPSELGSSWTVSKSSSGVRTIPMKCLLCSENFSTWKSIDFHLKQYNHLEACKKSQLFFCPICDMDFGSNGFDDYKDNVGINKGKKRHHWEKLNCCLQLEKMNKMSSGGQLIMPSKLDFPTEVNATHEKDGWLDIGSIGRLVVSGLTPDNATNTSKPVSQALNLDRYSSHRVPMELADPDENGHYFPNDLPGKVLIFSNDKFNNLNSDRKGSNHDVKRLEDAFSIFNMDISVERNLTKKGLDYKLKNGLCNDLRNFSSLIVCILSHGEEGTFQCSCGNYYPIKSLADRFKEEPCIGLRGKPRIFIINACRGETELEYETDGKSNYNHFLICDAFFSQF